MHIVTMKSVWTRTGWTIWEQTDRSCFASHCLSSHSPIYLLSKTIAVPLLVQVIAKILLYVVCLVAPTCRLVTLELTPHICARCGPTDIYAPRCFCIPETDPCARRSVYAHAAQPSGSPVIPQADHVIFTFCLHCPYHQPIHMFPRQPIQQGVYSLTTIFLLS